MSYPLPPEISTSYSGAEQALGDGSLPGQELDVDFAAVRASITSAIEFLKGITRSDGKLANGIVTQESLAAELIIGFDTPESWATDTDYTTSSLVFEGPALYICTVAHTSTVFATDLSSGRWSLLADLTPPGGGLVASNNLSDLTDVGNARANLGLGSMATASAGTGAAQHRTNSQNDLVYQAILTGLTASVAELNYTDGVASPIQTQLDGKQPLDADLTAIATTGVTTSHIAAATLVTASETIGSNNNDTTIPTSAAVKAYADSVVTAPGSAPLFAARAWGNIDGTAPSFRASGNCASVTRPATGIFEVTLTTAMPDANYSVVVSGTQSQGEAAGDLNDFYTARVVSASVLRVRAYDTSGAAINPTTISFAVFR